MQLTARRAAVLVAVGLIGGFLAGVFGIGGGVVMVPLLIWMASMDHRRASATSLIAVVPTSIASGITYFVQGQVDVVAALLVAAGGVGGSLIGTRLLRALPIGWLRWLFIAMLLLVAVRLFFPVPDRGSAIVFTPLSIAELVLLGLVMGVASGLFGIGGGVFAVPILMTVVGASDLIAKGTSLLAIIPTSIIGTVANVRARLVGLREGTIVGIAATVASLGGVAVAVVMPVRLSAILFAVLVIAVAIQLSVRAVRDRNNVSPDEGEGEAPVNER